MKFTRLKPHPSLEKLIECYWMMESADPTPKIEKIIPDGFTELIFNYGNVYKIKKNGVSDIQTPNLLAGQISSYFFLENTGTTGSFAVKLKPAALTQLFGLNMEKYLDQIIDMETFPDARLATLVNQLPPFESETQIKKHLDKQFMLLSQSISDNPLEQVLDIIFDSKGTVNVKALLEMAGMSERQLQRLFKRYVGLSPKYYLRIIRFNYIFELIREGKSSWTEIVYLSGYYDQSHFIRNFKAFTGEDPSSYFFEEKNMANFFLNKSTLII